VAITQHLFATDEKPRLGFVFRMAVMKHVEGIR